MDVTFGRAMAIVAGLTILSACGSDGTEPGVSVPTPAVFTATGDVAAQVEAFRHALGDPQNGGIAGEQAAGRREITWDGAGANPFNNRNDFPANFFNTNVKSGAVFTTPGTGFRNDSLKFSEVNAEYANEFRAFSPTKVFAPVGSNVMDVLFEVAGQPTPALVTGFGVVLSDVDSAARTTIELFDVRGQRVALIASPVRSDANGLTFVGAVFDQAIVARARLTLGTGALGANAKDVTGGGTADLVVADNFIYGEPKHIP